MRRGSLSTLLLAAGACSVLRPCDSSQRPTYCPSWNPLALPCPLADDAVQRLESLLDANVAGQMIARRTIEKALAANVQRHENFTKEAWNPYWTSVASTIYSPATRASAPGSSRVPRPLFMHFSGPTGVGKSLTADIVAEAILSERKDERHPCGKLLVQMHQYSSPHAKHVDAATGAIRSMVAEQLYHCPRSVLIFDEIQRAPEQLLDNIIDIFDRTGQQPVLTYPPHTTPLNTSSCIIIVVSDIGSTKLNPDMDRDAAKRAVEEDADSKFQNSEKRALLQNIVPFLPLSLDDMKWVAAKELKELGGDLSKEYKGAWGGKLTWAKGVPLWMATRCNEEISCVEDGGRGIDTMVEHEISGKAEAQSWLLAGTRSSVLDENEFVTAWGSWQLDEECSRGQGISFNNVDLKIASDGMGIVAVIDEVYNRTEFQEL